jgi:Alpha/beta hydrolase domain
MRRPRRAVAGRARRRALLALTLAGALGAQAAGTLGITAEAAGAAVGGNARGQVTAAEARSEDVAVPTVTGPVTGGSHNKPFLAMPPQLREQYGYIEEDYFIEGEATAYAPEGELGEDGRWTVREASTAPYKSRILVRRPADPADFDGTVFVEWFNVTGGLDVDADFSLGHHEVLRNGSIYVGVSAQAAGVNFLKSWETGQGARYASLAHPGDQYSYDIFSQAAQAIRRGEVDVLGGSTAEQVIGMGESQSGARMATYVDAVHPVTRVYDGFLVHSRGSGAASLAAGGSPIGEGVVHIRDDLDVPVLQLETEGDVANMGFAAARQDDTDMIRTWEVAGTSHADMHILDYTAGLAEELTGGLIDLQAWCPAANRGPHAIVVRGALAALRTWAAGGTPPREAQPIERTGNAVARDELGIARGGVRTPLVDAPTAVHTSQPSWWNICGFMFGETRPLDAATLRELYPTHQDYVDAVTESAHAASTAGHLARADVDALIAEAEEAPIPPT